METFVYASFNKNEQIRRQSSSGGIFYALAEYVLDHHGVVFGARFDESWMVKHDYCETIDELSPFLGSKYVQSKIGDTYKQVKFFLDNKRLVLFCGTPCQIYGLKNYLKIEYENLILVDFVCHGVPSPEVWKAYLDRNFDKDDIININFRDKKTGWNQYSLEIKQKEQTYSCIHNNNEYMKGFLKDIYLRPSCYQCKFKGIQRCSDFTLGDLWGIDTFDLPEEFYDDRGVSFVMINSKKGKTLFANMRLSLHSIRVDIDKIIEKNPMIIKSTPINNKREKFYKNGIENGILQLEKILRPSLCKKIKRRIKRILKG